MNTATKQPTLQDYTTTITILEHISDAIFILSARGMVEYANTSALNLLGYELGQIIGKNLADYLLHEDGAAAIHEMLTRETIEEMETELIGKHYAVPVLLNFGVVRSSRGGVSYIIASARDISWRKEMERTTNQKRILALSRDHYREMGELAVNMVHNLGQPLTSVRLKLELAQKQVKAEQPDIGKVARHLEKINQLLDGIQSTVEDVRQFASQTEDESYKPVNIGQIVDNAQAQLSYEFTENNVECEVAGCEDTHMILANPITLQQVFVTLLRVQLRFWEGQAVKSASQKIRIRFEEENGKWLCIYFEPLSPAKGKQASQETSFKGDDSLHLIDMQVVQLISETLGGDFKWEVTKNRPTFRLRFPLDQHDEREQLRNLIELFHDK